MKIKEKISKINRLKNKIWQKNSNQIPKDLNERIEKYLKGGTIPRAPSV